MAALVWDKVGDRIYQTGIDRGVLYLPDVAVAWNGLTAIEERFTKEIKTFHLDGVKYLESINPGDFSAQLKAYTYPDAFDRAQGILPRSYGLSIHDQRSVSFGLSYRTLIGDDVSGTDRGYKIHLLYNLLVLPENNLHVSVNAQASPIEFSWILSSTPEAIDGFRPTAHISFDSTKTDPSVMAVFERILYGTDDIDPVLPSISDVLILLASLEALVIVDHGDGTWSATSEDDSVIVMLDGTTFELRADLAVYLDPTEYTIPTT